MAITRIGGATAITGTIPQGNIANASLGAVTALPGAIATGKVLQIQTTFKSSVSSITTNGDNAVDITGMSVAITPSASSSKILVQASLFYMFNDTTYGSLGGISIMRNTGEIGTGGQSYASGTVVGDDTSTTAISDENFIYIKGGFGEVQLGNKEGAGDKMTITAADLMGPDSLSDNGAGMNGAGNLVNDNASLANSIADNNNVTYYLPSMGGFSLGGSYLDNGQGAAENDDITTIGAKYEFESGAVNGSLHYGNSTTGGVSAGDSSLNADSMGIKISSGPFNAVIARASADATAAVTTEITDYGLSYDLGNGITLAVAGTQIDENTGGETSDITSVSVKYNIASGLDAYLTYHDYDYEDGTTATAADDDGSKTLLTLKASF